MSLEHIETQQGKFRAIADKIRNYTNDANIIIPNLFDEKVDEVYGVGFGSGYGEGEEDGYTDGYDSGYGEGFVDGSQSGMRAQYNNHWNMFQNNGQRKDWRYAFLSSEGVWTDETLRPKYDIEIIQGNSAFYGLSKITKLKKGFYGEEDLQINTSKMVDASWFFFNMKNLIESPTLDFSNVTYSAGAFYGCNSLRKLHLIVSENTVFDDVRVGTPSTFCGCSSLTDLTIDGTIANDVNFSDCTALSGETVYKQIVMNLKDYSGTDITHTLVLGQPLITKVIDYYYDGILEAVRKGWVVI